MLFLEHKKMYRSVRGEVPDGEFAIPLGRAAITRPGTQITLVAYGLMAHYALEAADRVADDGISVEVVDLRCAPAARQGDAPWLRPQDRQVPHRLRGQPVRRLRRGDRGDRGRGGLRIPGRTGDADRRPGRPRRCRTTTSSRTGSWSTPRRSTRGSASSRPIEAAWPGPPGGRPCLRRGNSSRSAAHAALPDGPAFASSVATGMRDTSGQRTAHACASAAPSGGIRWPR